LVIVEHLKDFLHRLAEPLTEYRHHLVEFLVVYLLHQRWEFHALHLHLPSIVDFLSYFIIAA
jgi:hypothetical protein